MLKPYLGSFIIIRLLSHSLPDMTALPMFDYGDVIYKMSSKYALKGLDDPLHSTIRYASGALFSNQHSDH